MKLAEGKVVEVAAGIESDFKITATQLEDAITDRTRVVMLNTPSNPTGSIYSYEELKSLAEVMERYPSIVIIADEIYEHINFTGQPHSISEFEALRDRVVIVKRKPPIRVRRNVWRRCARLSSADAT